MAYDPFEDDEDDDAELMALAEAAAMADFDDDLLDFDQATIDRIRDSQREEAQEEELTLEQAIAKSKAIAAKRFEPVPFVLKATKKTICVIDTETDPFAVGLVVKPFCIGIRFPDRYVDFWGADCIEQFFAYIATLEGDFIFYAHNGGKFDFFFLLKFLDADQTPLIMNGRLVKIFFQGQEFRDSYAILPMPLSGYQKEEIDYALFVPEKRERHKVAILKYMQSDCDYLYDLIIGFHELFGDKLTIASAALPMLNSYHGFERMKGEQADERFRNYYYGGRVECFERGILYPRPSKTWKVVDRNSMYPAEMRDSLHPISATPQLQRSIDKNTDFALIEAYSEGALPVRQEDGSLSFPHGKGVFYATIHEINAGLETNTLKINRVRHAYAFERKTTFDTFVMRFYGLRLDAKEIGDKIRDILYKFCLNSPYGKFALNPRKFKQYMMTIGEVPKPLRSPEEPKGWSLETQSGDVFIWSRPNPRKGGFYNVATAASITGAARANLWLNIKKAIRPIYCDTDSIICEDFTGDTHDSTLGGWKLEAEGDLAAIAGKKLYAVFNENEAIKKAAKGVSISALDILDICKGGEILYENPVPNFKLDGTAQFTSRRVRQTGR